MLPFSSVIWVIQPWSLTAAIWVVPSGRLIDCGMPRFQLP